MEATAKDLRFHSKEILETVSRGEEVIITYRGKPHAKLVPIETPFNPEPAKNKVFGIWKDYDTVKDVSEYIRAIRRGRFS